MMRIGVVHVVMYMHMSRMTDVHRSYVHVHSAKVSSRIFLVWGIIAICPDARHFYGFALMAIVSGGACT